MPPGEGARVPLPDAGAAGVRLAGWQVASRFLGFAIRRAPGFSKGEKQGYLFNKIDFTPSGPEPSDAEQRRAHPEVLWWDSAIATEDRGKTFAYTVVPVLGTGPNDLALQEGAALTVPVTIPAS